MKHFHRSYKREQTDRSCGNSTLPGCWKSQNRKAKNTRAAAFCASARRTAAARSEKLKRSTPKLIFSAATYGYDARRNLSTVNQGSQFRSFQYDNPSRLTDAANPESGHIGYQYEAASNLAQKTGARSVVTA